MNGDDEIDAVAEVPSQHQANKLVRVLTGNPHKLTNRVHKADGSVVEWQSDNRPKIVHHDDARALWICDGDYSSHPIMPYEAGMVILSEDNPK